MTPETVAGTDDPDEDRWLDAASEDALRSIIPFHMDAQSAILHGRWWQLERYLRSLVYVELRALQGTRWLDTVTAANKRLSQDAAYTHLSGPDNDNPLAYLDYSQLLDVIKEYWDQVGYALFPETSWAGRQDELKRIRHRISHVRRPHADDVGRLEQALRDLERGAFIAYASYNRRRRPDPAEHDDPVTRRWLAGDDAETNSLLEHAERRYDTSLEVRTSRRPWVAHAPEDLRDAPGCLWHAEFFTRSRYTNVFNLWRDVKQSPVEPLLVQLEINDDATHIGFTFSAADDAEHIADAIDRALRLVMSNVRTHAGLDAAGASSDGYAAQGRRYRDMDYRIASGDGWTIVDDSTLPISNFGTGGSVRELPRW